MRMNISEQFKKTVQSMTYLLNKSENGLDKILIMKMLWATDRYHLRKYGRLVTFDTYCALPKGPVPSLALDILNRNDDLIGNESIEYSEKFIAINPENKYGFTPVTTSDNDVLSETDTEALDFGYDLMKKYIGNNNGAVEFTHKYPEWKRFENLLNSIKTSVQMDIFDFFVNPDKSDMPTDFFEVNTNQLKSSEDIYRESQDIKQILYI